MALRKVTKEQVSEEDLKGLLFNLDNGDLTAIQEVVKKWKFKDEESALRFALAVMRQSKDNILFIESEEGKIGLTPKEDLLKQ